MVLQGSKPASPVLFLKYMTATEGLSVGGGTAFLFGMTRQRTMATTARATKTIAGTKSFFTPTVRVISFEVKAVFFGMIRAAVGIPSSIRRSSARSSAALWYRL